MRKDPRSKNVIFEYERPFDYVRRYGEALHSALSKVDAGAFENALALLLEATRAGKRVYVGGNGGSAAIADHLCCDITKGAWPENGQGLRTHSLVSNNALFTALANDCSFDEALSAQVEMYADKGDVVLLISSSGNSANIVKAAKTAKEKGAKVLGFSGFNGGELNKLADISLHVPFENYGVVEDAHQALMHSLAQLLHLKLQGE